MEKYTPFILSPQALKSGWLAQEGVIIPYRLLNRVSDTAHIYPYAESRELTNG